MTHVYSIFDVLFLVCMKQCVRWNTIAVKPSEKAVNSRVCESKLHGKSICLFLWGLMSCGFSSRQNDYSCTVYQKWESWPCLVTFYCFWNDAHNGDLWRYQVWYVFLRISFYKLIFDAEGFVHSRTLSWSAIGLSRVLFILLRECFHMHS